LAVIVAKRPPVEPPKPPAAVAIDSGAASSPSSEVAKEQPAPADKRGASPTETSKLAKAAVDGAKPGHKAPDTAKAVLAENTKLKHAAAASGKGKRAVIVKLADNGKGKHVVADNAKSRDIRRVADKAATNHVAADKPVCTKNANSRGTDAAHRGKGRCVA